MHLPYFQKNLGFTHGTPILEQQLAEAKEREEWLKLQLEKTTHLLEDKTVKRKKFCNCSPPKKGENS